MTPAAHRAAPDARPHPTVSPRWAILAALAAVQAAVLPALGLPMFFRNEAAWHYLRWQRTPFFELFQDFLTSRSAMSNAVASRPLVRALEWLQVRAFGLDATNYVVFNGVVFVGFALALFALAWRLSGTGAAVLVVLLLMGCSQLVFYPVLNAIHGLQYPLEMALCTASLLAFAHAFAGNRRAFAPALLLAVLAFVTHAASAIVVPLAVAAMAATMGHGLSGRARRLWTLLAPLGCGLAFVIERGGVPGGLASQPGPAAKLQFALAQLGVLGALTFKLPGGPALLWALASDALDVAALRRNAWRVPAALVAGTGLWLVGRAAPAAGMFVLAALIGVAVWRRPAHLFLGVWAAAGVVLFMATPESNASYTRHVAVPCLLLMADAYWRMLLDTRAIRAGVARRPALVEWASAAATSGLVALTLVAMRVPIPAVSSKLEQVRYVRDLSLNFRDALGLALTRVPEHGTLAFVGGRSRAEEMQSLYGADYFARLQPAKSEHYDDFVALLGRPDVRVRLIAPDSLAAAPPVVLLAVNAWEIEQATLAGATPAAPGLLRHGRATAGIFELGHP